MTTKEIIYTIVSIPLIVLFLMLSPFKAVYKFFRKARAHNV